MRFAGRYCVIVGALMLAQWAFFLGAGQVPELETEPLAISFHLAAEALTALALVIGGAAVLRRLPWGRDLALLSLGALVYTAVNSPGYFAELGQWPLVGMFAVILATALLSAYLLLRQRPNGREG